MSIVSKPQRARTGLVLATAAVACFVATPSSAQGLLGAIFGGIFGAQPRPPISSPAVPTPASAVPVNPQLGPDGLPLVRDTTPTGPAGAYVSYCVRLCDGRYFPIGRNTTANPAELCHSACPASATKIFSGAGIDNAVATDGTRYASIDNAYVYRKKIVDGCTCNGRDTFGLAPVDASTDPTLKRGDIVMTAQGPVAFTGQRDINQVAKFTPVQSYEKLSADLRAKLAKSDVRADTALPND